MDNAEIYQQLQNYDNFGIIILAAPPLPIPELAHIWEWDTKTGLPIFGNPDRRKYYFLSTFAIFMYKGITNILFLFYINILFSLVAICSRFTYETTAKRWIGK